MSFKEEYSDYLVHYGVPGMKWGVRKSVYKTLDRGQKRTLKDYAQRASLYTAIRSKASIRQDKSSKAYAKAVSKAFKLDHDRVSKLLNTKIDDVLAASRGARRSVGKFIAFGPAIGALLNLKPALEVDRNISRAQSK